MDSDNITFTREERFHILKDIARWKAELHMNDSIEHRKYRAYLKEAAQCNDEELKRWWDGNVGEWVASRGDLNIPPSKDIETWLDEQFNKLIQGEDVEYGYVIGVSDELIREIQDEVKH